MNERYRVQFYTERHDGTYEYCVCDFGDEAGKTRQGPTWSPKVQDAFGLGRESTSDRAEAERLAKALNGAAAEERDENTPLRK